MWDTDLVVGRLEFNCGRGRYNRLSSVSIDARLESYVPNFGEATLVFEVKAVDGKSVVYDNVVPITFDQPGTKSVRVSGIPSGYDCSVSLLERGVYKLVSSYDQWDVTSSADDEPEVSFTLTYGSELNRTKSLLNHFTYDDNVWKFKDHNSNVESNIIDSDGVVEDNVETDSPDIAIHETVEGNVKNIIVENIGDKPAFVRAKVIKPSNVDCLYSGNGWSLGGDGYYYYGPFLSPGERTGTLQCRLEFPTEGVTLGTECNAFVIVDSTVALIGEDGNINVDW